MEPVHTYVHTPNASVNHLGHGSLFFKIALNKYVPLHEIPSNMPIHSIRPTFTQQPLIPVYLNQQMSFMGGMDLIVPPR